MPRDKTLPLPPLEEIHATLRGYIEERYLPPGSDFTFEDDEDLFEAGLLDSAGLLSYLTFVEAEYGLSIPDEDLLPEYFGSVSASAGYVLRRHGEHTLRAVG